MTTRGVNKVILIGNLGHNPEIRYMSNGGAVTNIFVATSEFWRDKNTGEQKEITEWHRVVLFGRLAEIAGEYLRKGSQVYIEGSLRTRKWQDNNNQEHQTTEILVNNNGKMKILSSRRNDMLSNNSWESQNSQNDQKKQNSQLQSRIQHQEDFVDQNKSEIFDDDIPF